MEAGLRKKLRGGMFTKVSPRVSKNMSAIKGRGNKTTEAKLRARLVASGIKGWQLHSKSIIGRPDFLFVEHKLAVFVDGCFWHGCPKCYRTPRSNRPYWKEKVLRNRKRDLKVNRTLRKEGWKTYRIWECQLLQPHRILQRLRKLLNLSP